MKRKIILAGLAGLLGFNAGSVVIAQDGELYVHENGIGLDPDRDTNPATITGVIKRVGDAADPDPDSPYRVINFEPPPGKHGDIIREAYAKDFGVHFGRGVKRQICEGQRRFYYDSMCTYEAAPSGDHAAGYLNYLNAPLLIKFDQPVCVVTMAIYPTGGADDEPFTVTIKGWDENDVPLPDAKAEFEWSRNTVRWKNMAGAYYLGARAKKITVGMRSGKPSEMGDVLRFLIDDLAFVQDGCADVLADFVEEDAQNASAQTDADANPTEPTTSEGS